MRKSIRVPLLAQLIDERVSPANRRVWMDLGRIQAGLVARLQKGRTRLIVADLAARQTADRSDWYLPEAPPPVSSGRERTDCVLCWDLLNYLERAEMRELSARLAEYANPGCIIHALIHYSGREMPARPQQFRMTAAGEPGIEPIPCEEKTPAPRYSPKALEKAMPDLVVDRTLLLNNGMQEFLFRLRAAPTGNP